MKKLKKLWIVVGIGIMIFFMIILISDIIAAGEKIRKISPYLEYGFYVLTVLLFYFLIFNPLRIILFSPSFSIVTVVDEENEKNLKVYKRIVKTLKDAKSINEDDVKRLESCETSGELREELSLVFNSSIKKEINRIIRKNAKTVLVSTAICQSGKLDMYTVISINIKMIKEIVVKCGFRPSYPKLGKLAVRVFSTALIAESLEGLDFSDIFPQSTVNYLADVPLVKPIATSLIGGISNALLTLRVGVVTRNYLFSEGKLNKDEIRTRAIKESLKIIPGVIKDAFAYFPNKIIKAFTKNKTEETD
ncbi:MAG: DUF697 domain-containing protein [Bacilli bacterium]|nr:YcjF family protein [Mollicutes bacterium]MDY4144610.1 DUF697 domain-containing protein [Bacilli bacterium]